MSNPTTMVASHAGSSKMPSQYRPQNRAERPNQQRPTNEHVIQLGQGLLIGRGRDGLIFRIGSRNMNKAGHKGAAIGGCWGGWVLKVPRFRLGELPQYYLKAVAQHIQSNSAEYHAGNSMISNFNFEGELQANLWEHLCKTWLPKAGFPSQACGRHTWQPDVHSCARKVHVKADIDEDNQVRSVDSTIDRLHCHMMPEGVMDAFQALIHHFSEPLLLNFLRDILHQLAYLEKKGVVHGDFKLSNVLLLVWNDKEYVFVLADFWDAYTVDSYDGSVVEMKTNDEMEADGIRLNLMATASPEFRRLLRWKFTTEKFGTRLYKDPHVLYELRKCKQAKKRFRTIRNLNAGAINLWSFGVVLASLLASNKDSDKIKTVIKDEILFSGRTNPKQGTLTEDEAVAEFRKLYENLLKPSNGLIGGLGDRGNDKDYVRDSYRSRAGSKPVHPNKLLGKHKLIDDLKDVIMEHCMQQHHKRGRTQNVIDALALDQMLPKSNERDIYQDLHSCGRCTMCVWMAQTR